MRCWRSSWAELWQNPAGPDLATTAGWEAMLTAPTRVPLTVDTGTGLLTLALREAYPSMSTHRIVGHADVAPDRKSDPWTTFDWPRYRALLQVKRDASGVA